MTINFDEIKRSYPLNDIVAASGERLTKNGNEWKCCCPFHSEKTESFTVYRDKESVWKYHCFAAETRVITREGTRRIDELSGQDHELLTAGGVWQKSPVRPYGEQQLYRIELSRNGITKEVFATGGHRWFIRAREGRNPDRLTTTLRKGDRLLSVLPASTVADQSPSLVGLQWTVVSVEPTERYETVYCAEVAGSHSFALEDNILTGNCFGCGAHGDNIDYVRERYGMETGEAARLITGENTEARPVDKREYREATNAYEGYDIGRPPEGTPPILAGERTPGILNPKRVDPTSGKPKMTTYNPSMVFPYRNRFGELIGYVLRVEFDDKKITPGVWWTKNKAAGFEGWSHGSLPAPRPMYGLPELYKNPEHQVLIVEGEKCKDAAARLMAGKRVVPVTWPGGGKSLSKVYWGSLKDRSVIIWPDNDEEGWKTAMGWSDERGVWHKGIVDYAFDAGVSAVKIIHITKESRPKGWDIADAEKEGLGQRGVELIMRERIQGWQHKRFDQWKKRAIERAMTASVNDAPDTESEPESEPEDTGGDSGHNEPSAATPASKGRHSDRAPTGHRPEAERAVEIREPVLIGQGFDITEDTWRQHLIMKSDGDALKANSLQNFALLLQYERRFSGIFAWNEFAKEVYLQRRPPWDITGNHARWRPRPMTEPDVTSTACWLEYCGMSPKTNDVGKIIQRVAQHNTYNPVVEALESFVWDGVPRLSGKNEEGDYIEPWLTRYMGAADSSENRAFGRKWMIGAVARAMQPGCKVDTMIVFEGGQGLKKSTALRVIADAVCPGVFTDEISDPNSKDAGLQMQGAFIIEISELDAFRRAEITQIKAWLSRQTDRFRRPYGKIIEEFPRSCVFAGTVNPVGIGYLKDPSGARRMWPVEVTKIEIEALARDAQQLWAEAVAAYNDGEQWWLDEDENVYAQIAQKLRYEEDPYGQMIDEYVINLSQVTTMHLMESCLKIDPERRSSIANRRIASHLHSRGWQRVNDDGRVYYVAPSKRV